MHFGLEIPNATTHLGSRLTALGCNLDDLSALLALEMRLLTCTEPHPLRSLPAGGVTHPLTPIAAAH